MRRKAIVIGSGIAGLAVAIRMAVKGYEVEVFETNDYPGGKLTQFRQGAYRFDAGPSLFTMPHYVDELFGIAGKNPADFFRYNRKNESCRYFWNDGTNLIAHANQFEFAAEVERKLGVPAGIILKKLEKSKQMYELAGRTFLEKPLNRFSTWITRDVARSLLNLDKLSLFSTMHGDNKRILRNHKLVQIFDRYATYNGSDPYRAPGILNIIPHFEHGIGTFHPVNGMYDITDSLYKLGVSLGVAFHFRNRVEEILVTKGRTYGIRSQNGVHTSDLVISNMDVTPTYRKLMPGQKAPERTLSQERSSSALIFYWGVSKSFPQLGLHNIFFSNDYRKEFQDIFNGIVPATDPTIYVNITSKDVPNDAPPGKENWFVMVNVPEHTGQPWEMLANEYRNEIISKLDRILKVSLHKLIENESILTPRDIDLKTSSLGGSLYGTSSNSRYAAFLRHTNNSRRIKGLYFCGGSVHPGGGIPLCLLSAKIVSDLCPKS